jgi:hypothetical protein
VAEMEGDGQSISVAYDVWNPLKSALEKDKVSFRLGFRGKAWLYNLVNFLVCWSNVGRHATGIFIAGMVRTGRQENISLCPGQSHVLSQAGPSPPSPPKSVQQTIADCMWTFLYTCYQFVLSHLDRSPFSRFAHPYE